MFAVELQDLFGMDHRFDTDNGMKPTPQRIEPASDGNAARRPRLIVPRRFADQRGWFAETFNEGRFASTGIACRFVQDNQSYSARKGTIRGIHFQRPPHAQAKLVRVVRGRILDVAVDVRRGSPTYGRFVSAELSAENGRQLYVPVGFAHAFCTLDDDVDVVYKVSDFYAAECEGGIRWDDPAIAVPWPARPDEVGLSDKDARLPLLREFESPFDYDGVPLAPLTAAE
jgi:dTDP-4-dehydrorhamnose 3,5-epimerase